MSDIQAGEVFVDGQSFNAARANNHVNGATILPGFVSGKAAILHGDVVGDDDTLLLLQASTSLLKKITITEFFQVAGNVSSVALTPPAGFTVSGANTGDVALVLALASQSANKALASPADGSAGLPTFRARDPRDSRYGTVQIPANEIDWDTGNIFWKNLTGTTAFTFANGADGAEIVVRIAPAGHTYSWPASVFWENGIEAAPVNSGLNLFRFTQIATGVYGRIEMENGS